ncbi:hypothetical protein [Moorena sp. SIO3H5]|uniref:hypothetical protein n=1 Tax=Moorena sp. SIO3H5 TaxID=2607834 RepID=UPI0013B5F832|nr:hypothetical protein [Moorena sp. SIO3H5]NEO72121.1 hypothetical protein [Moorena sp. SIO3H5]
MNTEQLHGQCPPIHNNPRVGIGSETGHGYRTLVGIAQINLPRIWVSKPAMPTLHNATDVIDKINNKAHDFCRE